MDKYCIDSSIWVDFYEDRKGFLGEPLGDYAFKLLSIIKANRERIVVTDHLIRELEMNYSIAEINGLFKPFEDIKEKIVAKETQREEAKKIAAERNIPKGDALHAILARDNNFIMITRDRHFKKLMDITKSYKPEDII